MCHSLQQPLGRHRHQLPSTHSPVNSMAHTQDTYTTSWFILQDLYFQGSRLKIWTCAYDKILKRLQSAFTLSSSYQDGEHIIHLRKHWMSVNNEGKNRFGTPVFGYLNFEEESGKMCTMNARNWSDPQSKVSQPGWLWTACTRQAAANTGGGTRTSWPAHTQGKQL